MAEACLEWIVNQMGEQGIDPKPTLEATERVLRRQVGVQLPDDTETVGVQLPDVGIIT